MHFVKISILLALFTLFSGAPASYAQSRKDREDQRGKQLQELADSERAFAAFTVKEGFRDGFIKFFADDGIGFGPHPERTREQLMKLPPASGPRKVIFNWAPMFGDISAAGDLGYTTGPVLYTDTGDNPRPPRHGLYFSVWQKQADGSWKVAIDMGVPIPQAAAAIETAFTGASPVSTNPGKKRPGDFRGLDAELSGSISSSGGVKAYQVHLDEQFRIHRPGVMPVTRHDELPMANNITAAFEFIDGKEASSGDLAFTYGKYVTGRGSAEEENGYYVHVWRRDGKGRWRLAADVQNQLPKTDK